MSCSVSEAAFYFFYYFYKQLVAQQITLYREPARSQAGEAAGIVKAE